MLKDKNKIGKSNKIMEIQMHESNDLSQRFMDKEVRMLNMLNFICFFK